MSSLDEFAAEQQATIQKHSQPQVQQALDDAEAAAKVAGEAQPAGSTPASPAHREGSRPFPDHGEESQAGSPTEERQQPGLSNDPTITDLIAALQALGGLVSNQQTSTFRVQTGLSFIPTNKYVSCTVRAQTRGF